MNESASKPDFYLASTEGYGLDIPWRNTYEAPRPKIGKELHPPDGSGYELPHIKWRDWSGGKSGGAEGHIYFGGVWF